MQETSKVLAWQTAFLLTQILYSSAPAPLSLLSTPARPVKMVWLKMNEPVKPAPTAPVTMLLMPAGVGECSGHRRECSAATADCLAAAAADAGSLPLLPCCLPAALCVPAPAPRTHQWL